MRDLRHLDEYRRADLERMLSPNGSPDPQKLGAFVIPLGTVLLRVLASSAQGWDHVSVSVQGRCPTWDEMSHIHRLFFRHDEYAMQLHVPKSEHVNHHPYTLHLWRPWKAKIPTPPPIMVGPSA